MNKSEALEEALREIDGIVTAKEYLTTVERKIHRIAKTALSLPRRNCDVGTAEEQKKRFEDYCITNRSDDLACLDCPAYGKGDCEFRWGQLPYESEAK